MARILVTEKIAEGGLKKLRDAGHVVDTRVGLSPEELVDAVPGAAALIIRSATQVTAEVLEAGADLVVVGRAGIGLDNVDVAAATQRGVMVVNAPQSNILSAAEHTMALLLAQARNVPQAHAALVDGRWERSKWEGVELSDKTLGVIGLGRIGKLVAQRAHAFGMNLVAYDPFIAPESARRIGVEMLPLDELVQVADFITLHLAKTPETMGLVGKELLAKAKPGIRIINVARGGIVDEAALAEAIRSGHVGGAAIDVFVSEPTTESPLFGLPEVVVTPHLGASTREAQDKAGNTIAEQVLLALAGEFVPFAVNVDANEAADPWLATLEGDTAWQVQAVVPEIGHLMMGNEDLPYALSWPLSEGRLQCPAPDTQNQEGHAREGDAPAEVVAQHEAGRCRRDGLTERARRHHAPGRDRPGQRGVGGKHRPDDGGGEVLHRWRARRHGVGLRRALPPRGSRGGGAHRGPAARHHEASATDRGPWSLGARAALIKGLMAL